MLKWAISWRNRYLLGMHTPVHPSDYVEQGLQYEHPQLQISSCFFVFYHLSLQSVVKLKANLLFCTSRHFLICYTLLDVDGCYEPACLFSWKLRNPAWTWRDIPPILIPLSHWFINFGVISSFERPKMSRESVDRRWILPSTWLKIWTLYTNLCHHRDPKNQGLILHLKTHSTQRLKRSIIKKIIIKARK